MVDEFYRDCDDAGGNEGMGAHDSGAREEGAAEKRQAATMASRYGLTLRIEILGQGQDRCDTMDNARHGAPADRAEQAGCDLVISLHLIDLGKDGRRDMSVHYGNAATQALADKLLAAVLPIAGTKSEETSPRPRLSVVKQEGAAALIELGPIGTELDRIRLLDPTIQGFVCKAVADAIVSSGVFRINS